MKKFIKNVLRDTPLYRQLQLTRQKAKYKDTPEELIYVHIGKCGGVSLLRAIEQSHMIQKEFTVVDRIHGIPTPILKNARYLIVIRNPISRALSAFNWRYFRVVDDGMDRHKFAGEYEVLTKYKTLTALAEALYQDGALDKAVAKDFRSIHHLREDISYYLTDLLTKISPDQIYAVLRTESLGQDVEAILGVAEMERVHEMRSATKKEKLELSPLALENLRRFLDKDFEALETLMQMTGMPREGNEKLLKYA